jgi:hypothetical protein
VEAGLVPARLPYDPESLSRDEVDEKALRGLTGVVKMSHTVVNGIMLVNLDGFAPASHWEELSAGLNPGSRKKAEAVRNPAGKKRVSG